MPLKATKFYVQNDLKARDQRAAYLEAALASEDPSLLPRSEM
ncbi:hypothetical protein [Bradyrhizobium sp. NC92]|nr:hypothetical protein [Bradyrhizobium sp. NC92]UWU67826.1 hypothetical protein N2602_32180 [Bradyrhizobium sp. NC92]